MNKGTRVRLIKDLTASVLFHSKSDLVYVEAGTEGTIVSSGTNPKGLDDILFDAGNTEFTTVQRWWVNVKEFVERV